MPEGKTGGNAPTSPVPCQKSSHGWVTCGAGDTM
jgi:hypothetical protein